MTIVNTNVRTIVLTYVKLLYNFTIDHTFVKTYVITFVKVTLDNNYENGTWEVM